VCRLPGGRDSTINIFADKKALIDEPEKENAPNLQKKGRC
jgi:hypothetical protein